jgi:hypothetical protein
MAEILVSDFGLHTLTTLDEWTSVLHLASKWGFESVRSLALRELLALASPVDKIVLGRKYGLECWLNPAFVAVCARAEPLSVAEAKRMDNEDVARINLAREQARASSMVVAVEIAQKAVACAFGIKEEGDVTTKPDTDNSTRDTSSTDSALAPCPQSSYAREAPLDCVATDLLADDVEVDDDLMEALVTWSRICDHYRTFQGFDHSSSNPDNQYNGCSYDVYTEYSADYESLMKYVGGPQLQATSLRRFLSVILQSELHSNESAFCTELFTDLGNRINERSPGSVGIGAHASVGSTEFTHMTNELCLELVSYECTLEDASYPFSYRYRPACLVANLANADLLADTTLRACFSQLISLPTHPELVFIRGMCTLLMDRGNDLDRENCRDLVDDVFLKLRKLAVDWRFKSVRHDILVGAPLLFQMNHAHLTFSELGRAPS